MFPPSSPVDVAVFRRMRVFSRVTPAPVKMEKPRDLGMLRRPRRRCSVPM
jgi:hypothetical protein